MSETTPLRVRVARTGNTALPEYTTPLSAGMDLRARLEAPEVLEPGARTLVPTGLHIELPEGHEAQVRPRSGLAYKHGLTVLNAPGTIDADYRGEIGVILINLSSENFLISSGDRIAQIVISKHEQVEIKEVKIIDQTERGKKGFGSTGLK